MGNAHEAAPSREGGQRRTADVVAGLRLSLTISLILAVLCEMIAGLDGFGQWVLPAARSYKSADLFAGGMLGGDRARREFRAIAGGGAVAEVAGRQRGVRRSSALRRRPFACEFTPIARRPRAASAPFRL